jgi:hypothetical protein
MSNAKENTQPQPLNDAVPDPEPAAPSLPGPDPGVFHHTPAALCEENQDKENPE